MLKLSKDGATLEVFATGLRANEIMHENAKNLTASQISQVAAFLSSQ
jgi:cytochrome c553